MNTVGSTDVAAEEESCCLGKSKSNSEFPGSNSPNSSSSTSSLSEKLSTLTVLLPLCCGDGAVLLAAVKLMVMENTPDDEKVPVANDLHTNINSESHPPLMMEVSGIILAGDDLDSNDVLFFCLLLLLLPPIIVVEAAVAGFDFDGVANDDDDDDDGFSFFFVKPIVA